MHSVFLVELPHMTLFHDISTASLIVPGWEIYTSPSMANERARHTTYVIELRQGGLSRINEDALTALHIVTCSLEKVDLFVYMCRSFIGTIYSKMIRMVQHQDFLTYRIP